MKVVISAAGKGTRMLHLTNNKSKVLINVRKRPFLFYVLKNLQKAGFSDIIIVVGYKQEKFREFLRNFGFKAKLVNQFEILGEEEYGTLCPLKCIKDIVGKENFLMLCGDNLYSVKDLKNFNIADNLNYIAGLRHKHPEKYGVLVSKNGFLEQIVEKPKKFVGDLINTGLYKFTPEIFEKIPQIHLSPRGEYELTDAISLLASERKVKIKEIEDYWLDFGNPGDIIKMCRFLKEHGNFKD